MKKIILFLFVCFCLTEISQAQCPLPYKELSTFAADTTTYIVYNFGKRGKCYQGQTVSEITQYLKMPVKSFGVIPHDTYANYIIGISINIYDTERMDYLSENKMEENYVLIYFKGRMKADDLYAFTRRHGYDWAPYYESLFNNIIIDRTEAYYAKWRK